MAKRHSRRESQWGTTMTDEKTAAEAAEKETLTGGDTPASRMHGALAHFEQLIEAAESDGERDEPVMLGDLATVMRLVVVAVQASYELGQVRTLIPTPPMAYAVGYVDALEKSMSVDVEQLALESEVNELTESLRNDLDEEVRNRRNDVRGIVHRLDNIEGAVGDLERAKR